MNNIILGIVLIIVNITIGITDLSWWTVLGTCSGALIIGFGLGQVIHG